MVEVLSVHEAMTGGTEARKPSVGTTNRASLFRQHRWRFQHEAIALRPTSPPTLSQCTKFSSGA